MAATSKRPVIIKPLKRKINSNPGNNIIIVRHGLESSLKPETAEPFKVVLAAPTIKRPVICKLCKPKKFNPFKKYAARSRAGVNPVARTALPSTTTTTTRVALTPKGPFTKWLLMKSLYCKTLPPPPPPHLRAEG